MVFQNKFRVLTSAFVTALALMAFSDHLAPRAAIAQEPTEAATKAEPKGKPDAGDQKAATPQEDPTYLKEKYGDWTQRCMRNQNDAEICQIQQIMNTPNGGPIAEITVINNPPLEGVIASISVIAPLGTLLLSGMPFQVDDSEPVVYPFILCSETGCVSRIPLKQEDLDRLKSGKKVSFTLTPALAPEEKIKVDASLDGFTAGYESILKINTAAENPKK